MNQHADICISSINSTWLKNMRDIVKYLIIKTHIDNLPMCLLNIN